jgi:hypothetical protein
MDAAISNNLVSKRDFLPTQPPMPWTDAAITPGTQRRWGLTTALLGSDAREKKKAGRASRIVTGDKGTSFSFLHVKFCQALRLLDRI